MVSIGKPEVGLELMRHLGVENGEQFIFADAENATYDSLGLNKSFRNFISPATAFSFRDRIFGNKMGELYEALGKWKDAIYLPPKTTQAFNQGGTFILTDDKVVFAHYDESTGAHVEIDKVFNLASDEARKVNNS